MNFMIKKKNIDKLMIQLDIQTNFQKNFINCIGLRDFYCKDENEIINLCISHYTFLKSFKDKNITDMVKEFVMSDIEKQRYILYVLLLDSKNNINNYIVDLLIDLLVSDSNTDKKIRQYLLDTLPWTIKKYINNEYQLNIEYTEDYEYNLEDIPLDKQIKLMKTSNEIKSKAFEKLKEINNTKNGESTAKAQQYLEGLLKVPFGTFKKQVILCKLEELIMKYNKIKDEILLNLKLLQENNILSDKGLHSIEDIYNIINEPEYKKLNSLDISRKKQKLQTWIQNQIYQVFDLKDFYDLELLKKSLFKLTIAKLNNLKEDLNIEISGKKSVLIEYILNIKITDNTKIIFKKYKILPNKYSNLSHCVEFKKIQEIMSNLISYINDFNLYQKDYFRNIRKILDKAVFGLDEAKNQIKKLLGQWITGNNQGYVFGFEGPPGTGKTTLAKKGIAECLKNSNNENRPFIFIAMGGSSNGSTLEGHNYTYVGSSWGRIVDGLIESKCMNPIIYIDELDKISQTEHGKEIVGILTHLTDPSQNTEFSDKYFSGIKFDISKCLIIFSYNQPELIDKILLDRIQRINVEALNRNDKLNVCKIFLIPEIMSNLGYNKDDIIISDENILYIIDTYTYEAGARKIKEKLYELYREINVKYLEEGIDILPYTISKEFIENLFQNYSKNDLTKIHKINKVGLINGLFATSSGIGGITLIESKKFASSNQLELKLTGMQGDVMKESMSVAKSLALSIIPDKVLDKIKDDKSKFGIHIHCPAGATPKDGPSAGTAITVCIISLLCNIPIRNNVGITGEIDLQGNVLPIGGLCSKADGGKMAGLNLILAPDKNETDISKIRKYSVPLEDETFKIETINCISQALEKTLIMPNNIDINDYFKL